MTFRIESSVLPDPAARPFEIVERKGIGHPDTICDALAERLSLALSQIYIERFGTVLLRVNRRFGAGVYRGIVPVTRNDGERWRTLARRYLDLAMAHVQQCRSARTA